MKINKIKSIKALARIPGLLNQKYDPAIMAEILATPEIKALIRDMKITSDFEMRLFKGFVVQHGTYDFYIQNERGKKENT